MTMEAMVRYLEARGYEVSKSYEPALQGYHFTIKDGEFVVSGLFEYPKTTDYKIKQKLQGEFLDKLCTEMECRKREAEKKNNETISDNDRKLLTHSLENFAAFNHLKIKYYYYQDLDCSYFRFSTDDQTVAGYTALVEWDKVSNIADAYERITASVENKILKYERLRKPYDTKGETKMNTVNMLYDLAQSNKRAVLKTSRGDIPVEIGEITADSRVGRSDDIEIKCTVVDLMGRSYKDVKPLSSKPTIKNVIFNDPATIVFWTDGTKTVVKAQDEEFDPEKGLAMAIVKKTFGNRYDYYNTMAHWLKKYNKKEKNNHGTSETV